MQDGRDIRYSTDEDGRHWLIDTEGKPVCDDRGNRIPGPAQVIPDPISGFTTYDISQGHCCFCGRLTCNGSCFK